MHPNRILSSAVVLLGALHAADYRTTGGRGNSGADDPPSLPTISVAPDNALGTRRAEQAEPKLLQPDGKRRGPLKALADVAWGVFDVATAPIVEVPASAFKSVPPALQPLVGVVRATGVLSFSLMDACKLALLMTTVSCIIERRDSIDPDSATSLFGYLPGERAALPWLRAGMMLSGFPGLAAALYGSAHLGGGGARLLGMALATVSGADSGSSTLNSAVGASFADLFSSIPAISSTVLLLLFVAQLYTAFFRRH